MNLLKVITALKIEWYMFIKRIILKHRLTVKRNRLLCLVCFEIRRNEDFYDFLIGKRDFAGRII